jgi:hypothetical protein
MTINPTPPIYYNVKTYVFCVYSLQPEMPDINRESCHCQIGAFEPIPVCSSSAIPLSLLFLSMSPAHEVGMADYR